MPFGINQPNPHELEGPEIHPWTEHIQRWEDQLNAGESVRVGSDPMHKALLVAILRRKRGEGPDPEDPLGQEAMRLVEV